MAAPHAAWWAGFWQRSSLHGSRAAHPPAILPGALLLRRRLAPGRAAHAVAGRVVGGRRLAPALERRLPQRPQHPDDLHRLPDVRRFRRGRAASSTTLEPVADLPQVRPGLLRRARRRRAGRDEPGRTTAGRLGPIQPLAHHGRLERAPLLSPLAPHRRRGFLCATAPIRSAAKSASACARCSSPDADGLLRLPLSSSPEIFDNTRRAFLKPNSNYDLASMKMLFLALAEMAAATRRREGFRRLGRDGRSSSAISTPNRTARCCWTRTRRCPAAIGISPTSSPSTRST